MTTTTFLTICNLTIRQDAEGRYCLNDLHKAAGGEERHQPGFWTRSDAFRGLLEELRQDRSADMQIAFASSRSGGNLQGTFVVKELVYAYAMWISPKFHLQVIRAYDALVTGRQLPEVVPETPELLMSRALLLAHETVQRLQVLTTGMLPTDVDTMTVKAWLNSQGLELTHGERIKLGSMSRTMSRVAGRQQAVHKEVVRTCWGTTTATTALHAVTALERAAKTLKLLHA